MFTLWVSIRHKTVIATQNTCIAKGQGDSVLCYNKTGVQTFSFLSYGRPMDSDLAELKHALMNESDQSTRNLELSQKGLHYWFRQLI